MSEPFLSEIRIVSFGFAPKGWAFCNGQLLPINQNQAIFSLLGTTYGGDGRVNFGLPNLQGRIPVHAGQGIVLGELGGETSHTLNISEVPAHTHVPVGSGSDPTTPNPSNTVVWARNNASPYTGTANTAMNPASVASTGGNQPHQNLPPYLVLNFIVALQGIFPSQT